MFLVRESSNFPGDYTLCLCFDGYIEHYHIMCNDDMLTIDEEEVFENLHLLVEVGWLRSATPGPVLMIIREKLYKHKNSLKWSKCIIQVKCVWRKSESVVAIKYILHVRPWLSLPVIRNILPPEQHSYHFVNYRKTSSISRTKSQNLNVSCIRVQLSSLNLLTTGVKLRMKM